MGGEAATKPLLLDPLRDADGTLKGVVVSGGEIRSDRVDDSSSWMDRGETDRGEKVEGICTDEKLG